MGLKVNISENNPQWQGKKTSFTPFRVNCLRLLICLAPLSLRRKQKVLFITGHYFNRWGQAVRNPACSMKHF